MHRDQLAEVRLLAGCRVPPGLDSETGDSANFPATNRSRNTPKRAGGPGGEMLN